MFLATGLRMTSNQPGIYCHEEIGRALVRHGTRGSRQKRTLELERERCARVASALMLPCIRPPRAAI